MSQWKKKGDSIIVETIVNNSDLNEDEDEELEAELEEKSDDDETTQMENKIREIANKKRGFTTLNHLENIYEQKPEIVEGFSQCKNKKNKKPTDLAGRLLNKIPNFSRSAKSIVYHLAIVLLPLFFVYSFISYCRDPFQLNGDWLLTDPKKAEGFLHKARTIILYPMFYTYEIKLPLIYKLKPFLETHPKYMFVLFYILFFGLAKLDLLKYPLKMFVNTFDVWDGIARKAKWPMPNIAASFLILCGVVRTFSIMDIVSSLSGLGAIGVFVYYLFLFMISIQFAFISQLMLPIVFGYWFGLRILKRWAFDDKNEFEEIYELLSMPDLDCGENEGVFKRWSRAIISALAKHSLPIVLICTSIAGLFEFPVKSWAKEISHTLTWISIIIVSIMTIIYRGYMSVKETVDDIGLTVQVEAAENPVPFGVGLLVILSIISVGIGYWAYKEIGKSDKNKKKTSRTQTSRTQTSRANTSRANTSRANTSRANTSRTQTSRTQTSRTNTTPRTQSNKRR